MVKSRVVGADCYDLLVNGRTRVDSENGRLKISYFHDSHRYSHVQSKTLSALLNIAIKSRFAASCGLLDL